MRLLPKKWGKRRKIIFVIGLLLVAVGVYGSFRPLPQEIDMEGTVYFVPDNSVAFLSDETYLSPNGERVSEQKIFDEVMRMIKGAEEFILVDMFLWNPFQGGKQETHRLLSQELVDALIAKKRADSEIGIYVVSDPINTVYEGQPSYQFEELRENGIPVILTDHSKLRDSNPAYSSFWRLAFQWPDFLHMTVLDQPYTFRWLPNIMDNGGEQITLRSYLKLFNFKANHRKLIVADQKVGGETKMISLVTSANPHDGSSAHSNVALRVEDSVWKDLVASEKAVIEFSGGEIPTIPIEERVADQKGDVMVSVVTERAILNKALNMIKKTGDGDGVELAIFYLSEAKIIDALIEASIRGADVRVILDPNKDAFGMEKNGIPNRSVAAKLVRESGDKIKVRWCATNGEQCHGKMLLVSTPSSFEMMLGSANFTRRNLYNLNLETNVWAGADFPSRAFSDARGYFERMWNNGGGRVYTHEYNFYKDEAVSRRVISWVMERTGLSTF